LIDSGKLPHDVLKPAVAAISVGVVEGLPLLDLCYQEDVSASVDFNVVMNNAGEFIEVQGTAEKHPFERRMLNEILDLAHNGIVELLAIQDDLLGGA
jgi:ribonuclease PH